LPGDKEGISLKAVVGGILHALREAKHLGDLESARLLEVYKKEEVLSAFTVPAFTISETELELRFALVEPPAENEGEIPEISVNISPEFLKGLEAHQVSLLKLKISPVNLRAFAETESAR